MGMLFSGSASGVGFTGAVLVVGTLPDVVGLEVLRSFGPGVLGGSSLGL
jgi:hypothetical protein